MMLQTTQNALRALAARVEALERAQCAAPQTEAAQPPHLPKAAQPAEECRLTALEAQWDNLYAYTGARQKEVLV